MKIMRQRSYARSARENICIHQMSEKWKIELIADIDGVLKIEREKLRKVNSLGEIMIASRHGDFPVKKGDKLAGTRVIPW